MLALALLVLAAPPATPAAAPHAAAPHAAIGLSLVGFDDGDIKALKTQLRSEASACGGARVVFVDVATPCDDTCLTAAAEKAGLALVALEALRFGGDVEVDERRFEGGSWVTSHRAITSQAFSADSLTPEACTALETAVTANTPDPELDVTPPGPTDGTGANASGKDPDGATPSGPDKPLPHPGWFVAGGGAVGAVVGLAAFVLAASTVEDPTSSGAAKEGALVQGWVGLTMLTVGVVAAGAGVAWTVVDAPMIPAVEP